MPYREEEFISLQSKLLKQCQDLNLTDPLRTDDLYCPRIFDGWSCWNHTKKGEIAFAPCPAFIDGFLPKNFGHKICLINGTWFRHPETGEFWSNYTSCVDLDDWKIGCQILHFVLQYSMVSNYSWMFCEGLYLHLLLVVTFIAERKVLTFLYVIGWGLPFILVILYILLRKFVLWDDNYCMIEFSPASYAISGPVVLSMLANFAFSINVIRILLIKLRSRKSSSSTSGTKKAIRATLILIPLLGLQYFITPFRPKQGSRGEVLYEYSAATFTAYQVLECLRKKIKLKFHVDQFSTKHANIITPKRILS